MSTEEAFGAINWLINGRRAFDGSATQSGGVQTHSVELPGGGVRRVSVASGFGGIAAMCGVPSDEMKKLATLAGGW